jgi:hypothetical protein
MVQELITENHSCWVITEETLAAVIGNQSTCANGIRCIVITY